MKISKSKFYTIFFAIVVLLQIFLPSFRTNILIQTSLLIFFFSTEKVTFSYRFINLILPIIILFLLGFIGMFIHKYQFINILKDLFHFIKPILGLSIGYFFYKKINNFKLFIQTVVICGIISASIHFFVLIVTGDIFTGVLERIRSYGKDSFLELFSLFFLVFYKKFQKEQLFVSKQKLQFYFFFLFISCVLYFSRTMIVTAILILITVYGYTIITVKTLKIIGIVIFSVLLLYAYLFSVKIERSKPGIETFLFKIKNAPAEIFSTHINRDDHKDLWDHWRGYESARAFELMQNNPSSYVFGCGHGSLVNLKFYAPLTANPKDKGMKYISELHNGYPYLLYKTGFIGMFFYLYFLYLSYIVIYKRKDMTSVFISGIGLFYLFTTLTITGFYNANDTIIFILGALLFFNKNSINKEIQV